MSEISRFIKKDYSRKALFLQLLCVILAFLTMVASSYLYVDWGLRKHLRKEASEMLMQAKNGVQAEFHEPQTALIAISENIRSMIMNGNSADEVLNAMKRTGNELANKGKGFKFNGLYGYFEAFGGKYMTTSTDWKIPDDYDPTDRPWYKKAVEAGDKIVVTPVYLNVRLNDYMVTWVRRIFDDNGQPLAVVCLNMPIDHIKNYVSQIKLTDGSYIILHDDELQLLYHPESRAIGSNFKSLGTRISALADEVVAGNDLIEREEINYKGELSIIFSTRLENGWVLYIVTPKDDYFYESRNLALMLTVLGLLFALVLCVILIRVDSARKKIDEENRQTSIKLAIMEKTKEADELTLILFNATPFGCMLWNKNCEAVECNQEAMNLFATSNKQEFLENFDKFLPVYQPNGEMSKEKSREYIKKALDEGFYRSEWMHRNSEGEPIPSEVTLVRVKVKEDYLVAAYIRDLREYKQMLRKIEQRDSLLNTLNHAAILFLQAESKTNMMPIIMGGMEYLGLVLDVDRVQIWQNETIDGILYFVHKYEWLSEFGKKKSPVPIGLKFSYTDKPEWENKFSRGEYINCPLRELPQDDQEFLDSYDIKTIVIIPLFLQERFWGFFSLDDCRKERNFSEEEINILRSGGLMIANAFLRNEMMLNIRNGAVQLESALKAAQEANAAKSKFLANISHEIRTPMNVILGVTERQLENENHPQPIKEAFEKIYNSSDLLLHIINDILDLSKIEAGKFEVIPAKYEVLSLINDTATLSIMRYGKNQIRFNLHADENIPLYLFGDELRIKQIINNLLSNAFKYTNAGEVFLSFTAEDTTKDKTTLVVCVRDTGQGMTEEQVKKLFDEYSRFNLEANRTTLGTGLGMAITHNLLILMNGVINIESKPGAGSTFTVRIPQGIAGPGLLGKETMENFSKFHFSDRIRKGRLSINRELMPYGKVLVVDDMKSNLDVAKLLLEPYELQINFATSGYEAIDKIKSGEVFDIVFMDHMMPKMDGMEATRIMRELGYSYPIIALTANAITGQQEMFLAKGFDGYISKPIDLRQLNDALNKYIRDKERNREKAGGDSLYDSSGGTTDDLADIENGDEKNQIISIPGVNTEIGLALYMGDMDIYISVLRSFVPNALSNMEKMQKAAEKSLQDYAVIVHGMKGISANIGAEKLSGAAFDLEKMAKSDDLAGVMAENEKFLEDAKNIVSNVQTWLEEYDAEHAKPLLEGPDKELLVSLCKYCEAYDMTGIDDIMDKLESVNYKSSTSLIKWLKEKINNSDFSSVAKRLSEYLEEKK